MRFDSDGAGGQGWVREANLSKMYEVRLRWLFTFSVESTDAVDKTTVVEI